jgi:hypothetical protein
MQVQVNLTNKKYIKDLRDDLRSKFKSIDNDLTMTFLEDFCHFAKPMNIFEPEQLIYKNAQRDLLLTLKTFIDTRLSDKEIAEQYKLLEE